MLQTLEREPQDTFHGHLHGGPHGEFCCSCIDQLESNINSQTCHISPITDTSPAANRMPAYVPGSKGFIENGRSMRDNPHKYLLYKPSLSQLMVFLSSGFKELPPAGALLLYMSADGCFSTTKHPQDCECEVDELCVSLVNCNTNCFFVLALLDGYELGGLATSVKRDGTDSGISIRGKSANYKEPHCLYPGDLYPYTRRPLFLIVESDNSFVFAHIPKYFGQPLVVLMSPQDIPQGFQGESTLTK